MLELNRVARKLIVGLVEVDGPESSFTRSESTFDSASNSLRDGSSQITAGAP